MFKLDLENGEEPEITLSTSTDQRKSKRVPENIYFCFIDYTNIHQGYILSTCLFNLYTEYNMQEEHIKNLRYADDTTFMAERKEEQRAS